MVPFGRAEGMHGETLLPSVLKQGNIDVFIVLKCVKFVSFFHKALLLFGFHIPK